MPVDIKEIDILKDAIQTHWYYRSKAAFLSAVLGKRRFGALLDIGAGSGYFSRFFLKNAFAAEATCHDPFYDTDSDEVCEGKPLRFRKTIAPADYACDLILMIDVLEHIERDADYLKNIVANAKPGTFFLLCVPAFMWLWSPHDVFLEHKRRYTLPGLTRLITGAGLRIQRATYCFGLLFPLAAARRLSLRLAQGLSPARPAASDLSPVPGPLNEVLARVNGAETFLLRRVDNALAGLSVVGLAVKP